MLTAMSSTSGAAVTSAFGRPARDRGRADACPGALRLHAADDGSLARIRLPGGLLTASQAYELAALAGELADGRLDLTSRGNVQLRGLPPDAGSTLAERLGAAGLLPSVRHERARNIVASPLSGLDGAGHADVRAWTRELDALLCASGPAAELSGRFLFALDDGRGDVAALDADVTAIARPDGTACLYVGGRRLAVAADQVPHAALRAAEEFLALAREGGQHAWRVRDLASTYGTWVAPPSGGPPALGVVGRGLSVGAPLGRVSVAQWLTLAGAAADADGELRVTPWRGFVLPGARGALGALRTAGFVTAPDSPWRGASACAGRPGCAKSLADVHADAAGSLAGAPAEADLLPVHWSGCERRCGHPGGQWVDVLATPAGYRVTVHGSPGRPAPTTVADARRTTPTRTT